MAIELTVEQFMTQLNALEWETVDELGQMLNLMRLIIERNTLVRELQVVMDQRTAENAVIDAAIAAYNATQETTRASQNAVTQAQIEAIQAQIAAIDAQISPGG